ncbi:MAG: DR2241 family protein [Verrucomicrobiota bacterium]
MSAFNNPAMTALGRQIGPELTMAEVLICPQETGFELRHLKNAAAPATELNTLAVADLRKLAQSTEQCAYRPLHAAPDLRQGWRCYAASEGELEQALNHLYPGAVADWFAAQTSNPPITHYREFTARQTGMYRRTAQLSDEQAARVIRACCHPKACLKRRLWTVAGLKPDSAAEKSLIPCLEPCAVLLDQARKVGDPQP